MPYTVTYMHCFPHEGVKDMESIVNAFADDEDIVPSHEHRELQNMLGGAVFNKVREIIPRPPN